MKNKFIIAGGGTGGHIFPALAIAHALKGENPEAKFLFVGSRGRMEMEKVPQAGFEIIGLDMAGYDRSSWINNLTLPWKLVKSFWQVHRVFTTFKPDAVIGVGGYASFPVLRYAQIKRIPSFLHEANSFAGRSNILLAKNATKVFAGVAGLERFFPLEKLCFTGNPVRRAIAESKADAASGRTFFSLDTDRPTLLVVGGSLGARSINEAIAAGLNLLSDVGIQLIWQTGESYAAIAAAKVQGRKGMWAEAFIQQMDLAYAAADVVVARSGAMTVAELAVVERPAIFVPFPLAAEDHQTMNAKKLVEIGAALLIPDHEAGAKLIETAVALCKNESQRNTMRAAIATLAIRNADERVAKEIMNQLK